MKNFHSHSTSVAARSIWLALICVLLVMSPLTGHATPLAPDAAGFEVIELPPAALSMLPDFAEARPAARNPKMDSALTTVAAAEAASLSTALDRAQIEGLTLIEDRVQVQIVTHPEGVQALIQVITAAGGEVTGIANSDTWLQAWLPVGALAEIAAHADVYYVSRPAEAYLMATTEGLPVINAPAWHAAGFRGAGVKVAIIDGGFKGYPGLLGSELPATVTVKNFVDGESTAQVNGATTHGAACAEIIHDIAPAASLYLAKIKTAIDLQEAVNWAMTQNVNIISTSLGWYNLTPGDGTGFFANLAQTARNAGILWITAAGNDRQAHWGGSYSDPDGDAYHNFAGTQEINFFGPGDGKAYSIPSGYAIQVFLRWDDWSAVTQDYDLAIVRWNGSNWQIVASGVNDQKGGAGQSPTEYAGVLSSGGSAPYGFVIQRYASTRNVNLEIFAPKVARLDKIVPARSLGNLADVPAVMTVAALDVTTPFRLEPYSAQGPTNGPGGTATGGAYKPDIAGFANVSAASYAPDKFSGTSAATPHIAGAAALVKGAYPAYTPAQTQTFLQSRAIDMGSAGRDTIYGYGRLQLGAAPGPGDAREAYLPLVLKELRSPLSPTTTPTVVNGSTPTPTGSPPPTKTRIPTITPTRPSGPQDGHWAGTTSLGYPMSFDVSANGTKWASFKLKTRFSVGGCSGTLETTVDGPGTISGGKFSDSSSTYAFSGQFNTSTSASGTYAWSNYYIYGCGYFTQSGTWTATAPASTQRAAIASGSEACFVEQVDQLENGQMRVCITQRTE